MSATKAHGNHETVRKQSPGRYAFKSEGRARFMRELNASGRRGPGVRPVDKGDYALLVRYKAGISPESPLYSILNKYRDDFLSDLGGEPNTSAMEKETCEHMSFLKILHSLQVAQLSQAKRMSRRELSNLAQSASRTAATFGQLAKALGFQRRQVPSDNTIVVKRYAAEPSQGPGDGQGKGIVEGQRHPDAGAVSGE
jgi:hypothetical protein